jgi:SulP family sulfate permease
LPGCRRRLGSTASVAPLLFYAVLRGSRVLAVGPVPVGSLMTASAVGEVTHAMPVDDASVALTLAFMSGLILLVMGVLRLGFLTNFLSHPVKKWLRKFEQVR